MSSSTTKACAAALMLAVMTSATGVGQAPRVAVWTPTAELDAALASALGARGLSVVDPAEVRGARAFLAEGDEAGTSTLESLRSTLGAGAVIRVELREAGADGESAYRIVLWDGRGQSSRFGTAGPGALSTAVSSNALELLGVSPGALSPGAVSPGSVTVAPSPAPAAVLLPAGPAPSTQLVAPPPASPSPTVIDPTAGLAVGESVVVGWGEERPPLPQVARAAGGIELGAGAPPTPARTTEPESAPTSDAASAPDAPRMFRFVGSIGLAFHLFSVTDGNDFGAVALVGRVTGAALVFGGGWGVGASAFLTSPTFLDDPSIGWLGGAFAGIANEIAVVGLGFMNFTEDHFGVVLGGDATLFDIGGFLGLSISAVVGLTEMTTSVLFVQGSVGINAHY